MMLKSLSLLMRCKTRKCSSFFSCLMALLILICGCGKGADQLFERGQALASDSDTYDEAEEVFNLFLQKHPKDKRSDNALMVLARIAQNRGQNEEAIARYEKLLQTYPQSEVAYQAQFMIGFIYEENLLDYERAKAAYQKVIANYPDSDLVDDAKTSLAHIGVPPEKWVKFKESN